MNILFFCIIKIKKCIYVDKKCKIWYTLYAFLRETYLESLKKRKKKYKYQILDKGNKIWYNIKDALSDARKN